MNGIIGTFEQKLSEKLQSSVGMFWEMLIPILIPILTQLFSGCFSATMKKQSNPEDARRELARQIKSMDRRQVAGLQNALSKSSDFRALVPSFWERQRIQSALVEVAKEGTEEEILAFLELAQDNPYLM